MHSTPRRGCGKDVLFRILRNVHTHTHTHSASRPSFFVLILVDFSTPFENPYSLTNPDNPGRETGWWVGGCFLCFWEKSIAHTLANGGNGSSDWGIFLLSPFVTAVLSAFADWWSTHTHTQLHIHSHVRTFSRTYTAEETRIAAGTEEAHTGKC